ncbi:uncharacterized protein [Aegilops tauschii subsp. strangulata]|uniref:uncharacterized protein n=1 Tax=Aegilops tauschii subsp. strangulata TaxID=200361 RepID=UPI003CC83EB2
MLCTSGWEITHPNCLLQCLSSAASNHCPLLVDCVSRPPGARRFHFERFWPKLDGFHHVVSEAWNFGHLDPDPYRRIVARLKVTARRLQSWSARTIGNVSLQLKVAREIIARLDAAQDFRPLSHDEAWLRRKLKCSYLGLASLERSIARQRVRLAWLRGDDVAVSYLKIHASHRKQRTAITSLQVGGLIVTSHDAMAEAAFHHISGVLGTTEAREFSIDQSLLRQYASPLDDLDEPFSEEEIWRAVKCLPSSKAPGPDGFTAEFLPAKQDIYDAFNKFYTANGRGFQKLNQALLTLLPERADAAVLSDYRPISLIHLIAKLFAKVLSLRLAPKLGAMVSTNQSAFIVGRCIHDNFLLVQ